MRKLLFTSLMGIGLSLFSGESQGQESAQGLREQIYLMDYLEDPSGEIPVVDCEKINALSDDQFYKLLKKAMHDYSYWIDMVPPSEYQIDEINTYKLLKRIHRCRPIVPFFWILDDYSEEMMKVRENEAIKLTKIKKMIKEKGIEDYGDIVIAEGWFMARKEVREAWSKFRQDLKTKNLQNKSESA